MLRDAMRCYVLYAHVVCSQYFCTHLTTQINVLYCKTLLCTAKNYSISTVRNATPILPSTRVLLQYYSALQNTIPRLICDKKNHSSTTVYFFFVIQRYYSAIQNNIHDLSLTYIYCHLHNTPTMQNSYDNLSALHM